ncbi:MAG: hypothetical protein D3918_15565, partial [Candidatus Electrothrix sp. AX2]|nr:hypothetical protein [Candidatus Electrothrix gigas]
MVQTLKKTTRIGSIIAIILFTVFLAGSSVADKVEVEITSAIPLLDVAPSRIILSESKRVPLLFFYNTTSPRWRWDNTTRKPHENYTKAIRKPL